jgi:hypothetical protein
MNAFFDKLRTANMYQAIIHLVVLGLAVEVFVLARQNRDLKQHSNTQRQVEIHVGDRVSLAGLNPITSAAAVDSSSDQLIYFFTSTCPFCEKNLPAWKEVSKIASDKKIRVIGICLDTPDRVSAYVVHKQINYDVFVPMDYEAYRRENHIVGVPNTVLRLASGRAERLWIGQLRADQIKEIAEAISGLQSTFTQNRREK